MNQYAFNFFFLTCGHEIELLCLIIVNPFFHAHNVLFGLKKLSGDQDIKKLIKSTNRNQKYWKTWKSIKD